MPKHRLPNAKQLKTNPHGKAPKAKGVSPAKQTPFHLLGDIPVPQSWIINKRAKGLTVAKILQHARKKDRRDISKVSHKSKRVTKWLGVDLLQFKTLTTASTSGGRSVTREHTVTVIPTLEDNGVILDCDCADFVFGGAEYSLAWHGAAFLRRGNGKAPVEKFPNWSSDYFACKHCLRVLVDNKHDFK